MIINGKEQSFSNISVSYLLKQMGLNKDHIVFELNGEIISKESYDEVILDDRDSIEIVGFVGGG